MVGSYKIRTDLALENREKFERDHVEVEGVILKREYDQERDIRTTRVEIKTEHGAKVMEKPWYFLTKIFMGRLLTFWGDI